MNNTLVYFLFAPLSCFVVWDQDSTTTAITKLEPSVNVIIVGIIGLSLTAIGCAGTLALRAIGEKAFVGGSNPKAPDAFTSFFLQSARIAMVGVIVLATVVLALLGQLHEGAIGILSGVAGYVLGGARPPTRTQNSGSARK
jgi:hypothetical protein